MLAIGLFLRRHQEFPHDFHYWRRFTHSKKTDLGKTAVQIAHTKAKGGHFISLFSSHLYTGNVEAC